LLALARFARGGRPRNAPLGEANRGRAPCRCAFPSLSCAAPAHVGRGTEEDLGDLHAREQLDHLLVEGRDVVRLAARDEVVVDDDLLVDPLAAGVADVGLERRP